MEKQINDEEQNKSPHEQQNITHTSSFEDVSSEVSSETEIPDGEQQNDTRQVVSLVDKNGNPLVIELTEKEGVNDYLSKVEIEERQVLTTGNNDDVVENEPVIPSSKVKEEPKGLLEGTSFIDESIYKKIPNFLKEACEMFTDRREKDVFLISYLTCISACLGETTGVYSNDLLYPNLYAFIIAPAGSNKSSARYAKKLCMKVHNRIKEESEVINDEGKKHKKKNATRIIKLLFIPANTSAARMYEHLNEYPNAILFETEADTLGDILKKEWGSFSDLLRKAFHHEPISYTRKYENQFIEIEEPRLAMLLTGTFDQLYKIVPSAENGLFSRIIFYTYKTENKWISPRPSKSHNRSEKIEKLSNGVLKLYEYLNANPTNIILSDQQWDMIDNFFSEKMENSSLISDGEDILSVIKRLSVITFRITMILAAIRKFEKKQADSEIDVTDEEVELALAIVNVFAEHSINLFNFLSNDKEGHKKKIPKAWQLYHSLDKEFTVNDIKVKLKKFDVSQRTIQRLNKKLIQLGKLTKTGKFSYIKLE